LKEVDPHRPKILSIKHKPKLVGLMAQNFPVKICLNSRDNQSSSRIILMKAS